MRNKKKSKTKTKKSNCIAGGVLCGIPFSVVRYDGGGWFDVEKRKIGVDLSPDSWSITLSFLLHEVLECALACLNGRFANPSYPLSSDSYVFQFDHNLFSMMCCESATFLAAVEPKVKQAWLDVHHTASAEGDGQ